MSQTRNIVTPGTVVGDEDNKPGDNTYRVNGDIRSSVVGVVMEHGDRIDVVALSGAYVPERGDLVVGYIAEARQTSWYVDVGAVQEGPLHISGVPWDIDFGATKKYLKPGDTIIAEVERLDETLRPYLGMEHDQCRRIEEGTVVEVDPTKVARLIGRKGSMIKMLKRLSSCQMFVGQNGRVWIRGDHDDMKRAERAVLLIEREAHTKGLTERVEALLKEE